MTQIELGPVLVVQKVEEDSNCNAFQVVHALVEKIFWRNSCPADGRPCQVRSATVRIGNEIQQMDLNELFHTSLMTDAKEEAIFLSKSYYD